MRPDIDFRSLLTKQGCVLTNHVNTFERGCTSLLVVDVSVEHVQLTIILHAFGNTFAYTATHIIPAGRKHPFKLPDVHII